MCIGLLGLFSQTCRNTNVDVIHIYIKEMSQMIVSTSQNVKVSFFPQIVFQGDVLLEKLLSPVNAY